MISLALLYKYNTFGLKFPVGKLKLGTIKKYSIYRGPTYRFVGANNNPYYNSQVQ